jgi:hypothetical protein
VNAEGEKGWELVGVCMQDGSTARAFFKQPFDLGSEASFAVESALSGREPEIAHAAK